MSDEICDYCFVEFGHTEKCPRNLPAVPEKLAPKLSLFQFYSDADARYRRIGERKGQAFFNHLHEVRPELAKQVEGTYRDPFYVTQATDPRWLAFFQFIESEWYK